MTVMFLGSSARAQDTDGEKQFIIQASQSDFTEIKFSQLASEKATNPQVKAFAAKMITDHQKLESDMKPFADKNGVTPAMELDLEHQQKYDALSKLSGAGFDTSYMSAMSADHHLALDLFKAEAASPSADAGFVATVKKGEKVVEMHTKMADLAVKKMGTMSISKAGI
jgi:putative membrane protein